LSFVRQHIFHHAYISEVADVQTNPYTYSGMLYIPGYWFIYIYIVALFITHSKMVNRNDSHFIIFVSHSKIKYIDNLKWLIKIINSWYFYQSFFIGWSSS
jgi:hypothetical protein